MATQAPSQPSSAYLTQAGLAASFSAVLRARWASLTRDDLYALLTQYARGSSALAAKDYRARRVAAGISSSFAVPLAPRPTVEHLDNTLNWVYADPQATEDRAVAAFTRLALQCGRMTVVNAVRRDGQARAWAREARADCCYFCAMLASRGAVYKDEGTAGRDANAKFTGEGEFKFHNNCHCAAVPVFGAYEMTAHARQWADEWRKLADANGGALTLDRWRDHFEGRNQATRD